MSTGKVLKVGFLGAGLVAKTMAEGCAKLGYETRLSSRGQGEQAMAWADVVILATTGLATLDAIRAAGVENFRGKLVIDATNPLVMRDGKPPRLNEEAKSLGEQVQELLPDARVVKAFNTVGANLFVQPHPESSVRPDMLIAGNDDGAKKIVSGLCTKWGWNAVDVGDIEAARGLEALVTLWIRRGLTTGSWQHAFKIV